MTSEENLLREASALCLALWNAGGPKTGGEQYPNMANVIDMHQRIEAHFSEVKPVVEPDLAAVELRVLALATERADGAMVGSVTGTNQRTDRILDALFGGTVTGRMTFPLPPGCGAQVPKPKSIIGVDEADYASGGLP